MEDEKKNLLKNVLGLSDNASLAIGLPVTGFGLVASLLTNYPSYNSVTKDITGQIGQISTDNAKRNSEIEAGFNADMANYGANAQQQTQQGLVNRGITDPAVAKSSASTLKSGLSGAYAAAHGALARAKVNAQNNMSSAMANYYTSLAQRQYDSIMKEYAAKNGIWGAIGGLGTGLMGLKTDATVSQDSKITDKDYTSDLGNYDENPSQFRVKGVKDSKPFRMKGVK